MSKSRIIAGNLGTTSGEGGGGVTVYDSAGLLPTSGNTAGDFGWATSKKALYTWDGSEWDRVYKKVFNYTERHDIEKRKRDAWNAKENTRYIEKYIYEIRCKAKIRYRVRVSYNNKKMRLSKTVDTLEEARAIRDDHMKHIKPRKPRKTQGV